VLKLVARFDSDGKGYIDYEDFSKRLVSEEFTPGDNKGISRKIIDENRETLKQRHENQQHRLRENQLNEAHRVSDLSPDDVLKMLR
jgi:hypothetical protein